ncbi:glucose-1-phosphate adenylyltransferase [Nonomuraea sp. NBC_01738]|uniref:glucose-1-phosphate adenylyltransferase n=1 Tax=Nonomuraea sp. NBC_01738 TaxID=2976003 RepID=UPI002E0DF905|nr:glucose-1-phosphate adenylyltransferase [Nonomuraea sp. NBC_01738]
MISRSVLAVVLAGGQGKRLLPLTMGRAKPNIPFGGMFRLIDFVLSNLTNAGYLKIVVLTQYQSRGLDRYLARGWQLSSRAGHYIAPIPAQQQWFSGSADALFKNLQLMREELPDHVLVFGADHVYRMDPAQMLAQHVESGADVTVAAIRQPRSQAHHFGVIECGAGGRRITRFVEKPSEAAGLPEAPHEVRASMGNYVFRTQTLIDAVEQDARDAASRHDIGADLIPMIVRDGRAEVYDFARNQVPGVSAFERGYWRDVGTLDAYYEAHMDLLGPDPAFTLHNAHWPIRTFHDELAPVSFGRGLPCRTVDSLLSPGVAVAADVDITRSVLSPQVTLGERAQVADSILMENVRVGCDAIVRRAIVDRDATIPEGARIGVDPDLDRELHTVTDDGIVIVTGRSVSRCTEPVRAFLV